MDCQLNTAIAGKLIFSAPAMHDSILFNYFARITACRSKGLSGRDERLIPLRAPI